MSFKGTTLAYLLKILITHNKKEISLINLLFNCVSARSAPQVMSIKNECPFRFSNFLITGFRNSLANSWFEIFPFLIPPPEADLSHVVKVSDSDRASKCRFLVKQFINH